MFCSECAKFVTDIKYYTQDMKNVFCDAYCSVTWHQKQKEKNDEQEEKTDTL